ncbi:MAG: multifunctional CCA addition/repair protein, partial [Burkholderiales bacterium]
MRIYRVGGSVRDELLGLEVKDRDYVVVGATPEEMERLGFKPVGRDFPVFLHPQTHEEHALARTERKTARGYRGFAVHASPEVTLEEDLERRDLTINAIAKDAAGKIIDPFGGANDLRAGILRHVNPAFSEDPVRVLRAARFAARFGFSIAPETLALMREMVENGEVDSLTPERVWQELARGLMEKKPSGMFLALRDCGALAKILPEVDRLFGVPQPPKHHPEIDTGVHVMLVIDCAAEHGGSLPVRFAALTHDLGKGETPAKEWPRHIGHEERSVRLTREVSRRIKAPRECSDLAVLAARFHGAIHRALELKPTTIMHLLARTDALR